MKHISQKKSNGMNLPAVIFLFIKQIKAEAKIINQRTEHATPAAIFVGKK
jgi:hypothetical protein